MPGEYKEEQARIRYEAWKAAEAKTEEERLERHEATKERNREKTKKRNKRNYEDKREIILLHVKEYRQNNIEEIREKDRQRNASLTEEKRLAKNARARQRRQENKEHVLATEAAYRLQNHGKLNAYSREWNKANPDSHKVVYQRRQANKRNLPAWWNNEHWSFAQQYFDYCCAVCETPLRGLFHTAGADHWIPLSANNCPGTIPTNMLPLCHGEGGCNNSKGKKDPEAWLTKRYGKRKANTILKRIHTYFDIVRDKFPLPKVAYDDAANNQNEISPSLPL